MSPEQGRIDIGQMRSSLRLQQVITAATGIALIIALLTLKSAHNAERVVIQTPWGDKSRYISESEGPSRQMLIDTAMYSAFLTQNVSSGSIESNTELLKLLARPSQWPDLKKRAEAAAQEARGKDAIKVFNPTVYTPDVKSLRVALTGEYRRWIGNVPMPSDARTFVYVFSQEGTRLYLDDYYESSREKPFERVQDDASTKTK
jgi:hypothetical protein